MTYIKYFSLNGNCKEDRRIYIGLHTHTHARVSTHAGTRAAGMLETLENLPAYFLCR